MFYWIFFPQLYHTPCSFLSPEQLFRNSWHLKETVVLSSLPLSSTPLTLLCPLRYLLHTSFQLYGHFSARGRRRGTCCRQCQWGGHRGARGSEKGTDRHCGMSRCLAAFLLAPQLPLHLSGYADMPVMQGQIVLALPTNVRKLHIFMVV